jgi:hypothetical protein
MGPAFITREIGAALKYPVVNDLRQRLRAPVRVGIDQRGYSVGHPRKPLHRNHFRAASLRREFGATSALAAAKSEPGRPCGRSGRQSRPCLACPTTDGPGFRPARGAAAPESSPGCARCRPDPSGACSAGSPHRRRPDLPLQDVLEARNRQLHPEHHPAFGSRHERGISGIELQLHTNIAARRREVHTVGKPLEMELRLERWQEPVEIAGDRHVQIQTHDRFHVGVDRQAANDTERYPVLRMDVRA